MSALSPTMRKLLRRVDRGEVTRNVDMKQRRGRFGRISSRYVFGWTNASERSVDIAMKCGYVAFVEPTEKLDNPFVAAGGVGGTLALTDKGRAVLGAP